jgi:Mrp family chromosome partitioning ATPase
MVASAMPGEGKTLTATNIALTLSESYRRRVVVIDTDLRRPSMHEIFQLPNHSGVNDALLDHTRRPPTRSRRGSRHSGRAGRIRIRSAA